MKSSGNSGVGGLYGKVRAFFAFIGFVSLFFMITAVTGLHEYAYKWLSAGTYSAHCDYILLLPAGPVPSPTMLLRSYKAAQEYHKNPSAMVVISHKTDPPIERSTIWGIRDELLMRGVPPSAILLETRARNTGEHAKYIGAGGFGDPKRDSYLLVTSPMHIRRSIMTFRAAGFRHLYASAARSATIKEELGLGQFFRYGFWNALKGEIIMAREFIAIAWYKFTGRL